jgi:DNA-binding LacI/PurR family transcriptional regulator
VGFEPFDDVYAALEAGGLKVSRWNIQLPKGGKKPETATFAAHEAFATRLSKSWTWFPDLIYFSDDYACVGALAAFAEAGVKVPGDVRIATWSNAGNNPVFAKELTRTEMDPEADAAKLATALLAHLEGHPAAFPSTFGPTFRRGATL